MSKEQKELNAPVLEQFGKAESFVKGNKKILSYVGGGILAIVAGYFAYQQFVFIPKEKEANNKIYLLEQYFFTDSFDVVLNGKASEDIMGAVDFVDEFGGTNAAQKAAYFAGIAYMNKKEWSSAIEYFEKFKMKDLTLYPNVKSLIGDCYVELNDLGAAAAAFKDAYAAGAKNELVAPKALKKLGLVYEEEKNYKDALAAYTRVKEEYGETLDARDIDAYISRAKAKMGDFSF